MNEMVKLRRESIKKDAILEENHDPTPPPDVHLDSSPITNIPIDPESSLTEIRSMWQLASILHFFHVFRKVIKFELEFTAEELENALIHPQNSRILFQVHKTLLKGISPVSKPSVNEKNWITMLSRKANNFWELVEKGKSPIKPSQGEEINIYYSLIPSERVIILYLLCELRVEQEDIHIFIDSSLKTGAQISDFRLRCLFEKNKNIFFWYDGDSMLGFRLYKETKNTKNAKNSSSSKTKKVLEGKKSSFDLSFSLWETMAASFMQFKQLEQNLECSRQKDDMRLLKILKKEILPELEELEKKRMVVVKRKERQALMLSNQANEFHNFFPSRSKRERKPVNYTFDEFDKSIIEAINSSKRKDNESMDASVSFSSLSKSSKRNKESLVLDEKLQSRSMNTEYLINNPRTRSDHLRRINLSVNDNDNDNENENENDNENEYEKNYSKNGLNILRNEKNEENIDENEENGEKKEETKRTREKEENKWNENMEDGVDDMKEEKKFYDDFNNDNGDDVDNDYNGYGRNTKNGDDEMNEMELNDLKGVMDEERDMDVRFKGKRKGKEEEEEEEEEKGKEEGIGNDSMNDYGEDENEMEEEEERIKREDDSYEEEEEEEEEDMEEEEEDAFIAEVDEFDMKKKTKMKRSRKKVGVAKLIVKNRKKEEKEEDVNVRRSKRAKRVTSDYKFMNSGLEDMDKQARGKRKKRNSEEEEEDEKDGEEEDQKDREEEGNASNFSKERDINGHGLEGERKEECMDNNGMDLSYYDKKHVSNKKGDKESDENGDENDNDENNYDDHGNVVDQDGLGNDLNENNGDGGDENENENDDYGGDSEKNAKLLNHGFQSFSRQRSKTIPKRRAFPNE